jgi:iron complex outermembrane receptor protein
VRAGASFTFPRGFRLGVDARYTGQQWLRGDEANEEEPLEGYFMADLRVGYEVAGWGIHGIMSNVFNTTYANFGTFNLNQGADNTLERFLTPGQPRTFRLIVRRSIGNERLIRE